MFRRRLQDRCCLYGKICVIFLAARDVEHSETTVIAGGTRFAAKQSLIKMNTTLRKALFCNSLFFASLIVIIATATMCGGGSALAASKRSVARIEESDLSFLLNRGDNDGRLFVYSSLSFLDLNSNSITFNLSATEHRHLIPSARINLYPPIQTEIRSEFFDFSIWGHLGNYFNRQIETIEIENDISAILQELATLNERYVRSTQGAGIHSFNTRYLKTINRGNYFAESDVQLGEERDDYQLREKKGKLQVRIQTNLSSPEETLKTEIVDMSVVVVGKFTQNISQEYDIDKVETLEDSFTDPGVIEKIMGVFVSILHYLLTNKIEALIYITILFFLINLIGLGLRRR